MVITVYDTVTVTVYDYNQPDLKELSSVQLEKMLEPQVWREAATQVFFALGLGFGGVIAFSSYNKRDNNCHFDAALVSVINFVTSILATLVVFAVLGFKANVMNEKCVVEWVFVTADAWFPIALATHSNSLCLPCSNAEKILGFLNTGVLSRELIPPHINFSHLSSEDYAEMYGVIKTVKEDNFAQLGLDACVLEDELNKVWGIWPHWQLINSWMSNSGLWSETWEYICCLCFAFTLQAVQGTGLAFIAFTEAMTHFPASPFWSVMFFFMLINLGLGSMIGTMTGITTPILDAFKIRKELLCGELWFLDEICSIKNMESGFVGNCSICFSVVCCVIAFLLGLLFVQRSGNYFVTMFDDYSAGLPLIVVVILENISVAWIYGTKRYRNQLVNKPDDFMAPEGHFLFLSTFSSTITLI